MNGCQYLMTLMRFENSNYKIYSENELIVKEKLYKKHESKTHYFLSKVGLVFDGICLSLYLENEVVDLFIAWRIAINLY